MTLIKILKVNIQNNDSILFFFIEKSFLELQLTGKLPSDALDEIPHPSTAGGVKPSHALYPVPSPRMSSPLPSLPSLPGPSTETSQDSALILENPVWERHVTPTQLNTLLRPNNEGLNPLEQFIGSLTLLLHWVKEASIDRYLISQVKI